VALTLAIQHETCHSYAELDCQPDDLFKSSVRQICGLFVTIHDSKLYLIHQTAREFLIPESHSLNDGSSGWQNSIKLEEAELTLSYACISLLCFHDFQNPPPWGDGVADSYSDIIWMSYANSHTFLQYSAVHWARHFQSIEKKAPKAILNSVMKLCDATSSRFYTRFAGYKDNPHS